MIRYDNAFGDEYKPVPTRKKVDKALAILERRREWLRQRIIERRRDGLPYNAVSYDKNELWAIGVVIDALEEYDAR